MIWPVNFNVDGVTLRYATAQLLCKLDEPSTYVFFTWPNVLPEFAFETANGELIEARHARVTRERGMVYVDKIEPGDGEAIRIRTQTGKDTEIIVLTRETARNTWKATLGGRERLILSAADVFFEGNRVHLRLAFSPKQAARLRASPQQVRTATLNSMQVTFPRRT
jgi:hypothetical protein